LNIELIEKKQPSRDKVWQMFDRIALRYDLLNHLLSAGQDIRWRSKLRSHIQSSGDLRLLDIATGTGDQLFSLIKDPRVTKAVGVDLAVEMLKIGRRKAQKRHLRDIVEFQEGDACNLPFSSDKFDLITISFGIRNVSALDKAISEMYRVLRRNGRALILEFSLPVNAVIKNLYLFYFRKILPQIGGMISGDSYAYHYLNETVENFPFGQEFCNLLEQARFINVKAVPLTFGVASVYIADKV